MPNCWNGPGRSARARNSPGSFCRCAAIVEPEACAICAERGSDADLARIERAYREMDAAGMDSRAYSEPDLRFHRGILTATGNDFLVAFGATVEAALRMSFELSTLNPGAPRKSLPYHRAMLDEIWARNPDGARARDAPADGPDRTEHCVRAVAPEERNGISGLFSLA